MEHRSGKPHCEWGETVVRIRIQDLGGSDSPRLDGVNEHHARALAEVDGALPPILVHCVTMRVIDGAHRLRAAEMCGRQEIEATFFHGTVTEAFHLAVQSNVRHGLPLTLRDKQEAATRILRSNPALSDRAVAATVGLAGKTVAAIRARTDGTTAVARMGRDGKVRPLDPAQSRRVASRVLAERPTSSLREIAREAGVSVGTVRDVRARLRAGRDPVTRHRDEPVTDRLDTASILDGLRRDPSLRYTDAGRALLRWLGSAPLTVTGWRETLDGVPPHCAPLVGRLARECGRAWLALAHEVEQRRTEPDGIE